MRALLDVNALLALVDPTHVHHPVVRAWWSANHPHGWASCPLTENGFLRIITQPRYSVPLSMGSAMDVLRTAFSQGDHMFWPDDISIGDQDIFNPENILGPKQITDIYLLALAVRNRGRLVTLDRSISTTAVRDATQANLIVLG
jgi:toxin-antitoxin system PIN domain toxin